MSTYQKKTSFFRYLRHPELFQAPPPVSDPSAPAFEAATFDVKVCEHNFLPVLLSMCFCISIVIIKKPFVEISHDFECSLIP